MVATFGHIRTLLSPIRSHINLMHQLTILHIPHFLLLFFLTIIEFLPLVHVVYDTKLTQTEVS